MRTKDLFQKFVCLDCQIKFKFLKSKLAPFELPHCPKCNRWKYVHRRTNMGKSKVKKVLRKSWSKNGAGSPEKDKSVVTKRISCVKSTPLDKSNIKIEAKKENE